jgi:transcriptional regulator with XRE-family HTH domain
VEPNDFKKWRKSLKFSQKDAAHALGLKRRMIQYYEKGERDGDKVEIPRSVRLACYALFEGVEDYHGPSRKIKRRDEKPKKDKDGEDGKLADAVELAG